MSYRLVGEVFKCCRGTSLKSPERLVFLALADRKNSKSGKCCPSITTLCAMTGYNRTTVLRALSGLEKGGHLTIKRRRRQTSLYVLHPIALEVAQPDFKEPVLKSLSAQLRSRSATCVVAERDTEPRREPGRNQEVPADAPAAHRRAAASRRPRKGARSEPPDGRVKALLDEFYRLHLEALHEPYRVVGGRDGKHLKDALRGYQDADRIRIAMRAYFRDEKGLRNFPASVPHFVGRIAFLLSRSEALGPAPTYVRADPATAAAERAAADAAAAAYRAKKGWT
jgi:hypothetical protein